MQTDTDTTTVVIITLACVFGFVLLVLVIWWINKNIKNKRLTTYQNDPDIKGLFNHEEENAISFFNESDNQYNIVNDVNDPIIDTYGISDNIFASK